jgi:hypothetical protein
VIKNIENSLKLAHTEGTRSDKNKQSILQKALNQMVIVQANQIGIIE